MRFRRLTLAAGVALLAACNTVPIPLFDIPASCGPGTGASTNMICAGTDLVRTVANKPPPLRTFDYAETDAFDLQLSSSLGAGLDKVNVNVPTAITLPSADIAAQSVPSRDSPRIVFWLAQVRNSGGEVKACEVQLESVLAWLLGMATDYAKARLTYDPANNYHATVYIDSQTDGAPIRKVLFTPRSAGSPACG